MKLTDFLVVLLIIALPVYLLVDYRVDATMVLMQEQQRIDLALDQAVDDAMKALTYGDNGNNGGYAKEECIQAFYNSIFASFGALSNSTQQELIKLYVPVFVVALNDGFYVNYKQGFGSTDRRYIQIWSDKILYRLSADGWSIYFDMEDDEIRAVNNIGGASYRGGWDEVAALMMASGIQPPACLSDYSTFDETRRYAITSMLEAAMSYYATMHNQVAENYGLAYEFGFSVEDNDSWNRALGGVSVMTVFQGMPLANSADCYNRFSVAASHLFKISGYYAMQSPSGNFYHKPSCPLASGSADYLLLDNVEECAKSGYYPCLTCNP